MTNLDFGSAESSARESDLLSRCIVFLCEYRAWCVFYILFRDACLSKSELHTVGQSMPPTLRAPRDPQLPLHVPLRNPVWAPWCVGVDVGSLIGITHAAMTRNERLRSATHTLCGVVPSRQN